MPVVLNGAQSLPRLEVPLLLHPSHAEPCIARLHTFDW